MLTIKNTPIYLNTRENRIQWYKLKTYVNKCINQGRKQRRQKSEDIPLSTVDGAPLSPRCNAWIGNKCLPSLREKDVKSAQGER